MLVGKLVLVLIIDIVINAIADSFLQLTFGNSFSHINAIYNQEVHIV